MQNICYRCGRPIEGQVPFCPACGAPQIRVSAPAPPSGDVPSEALEVPADHSTDYPDATPPPPPLTSTSAATGMQWKIFLRTAAPLAVLSGMLTIVLPPLGLFIALPACLFWSVANYRRRLLLPLLPGQGARMGALMALLSFLVFLFFSLALIFAKTTEYRDFVLSRIHEIAARNPDPQSLQTLQWFSTPNGLIAFTAIGLSMILVAFLVIGMACGALAVAMGKPRTRP